MNQLLYIVWNPDLVAFRLGHCLFYEPGHFLTSGKGFVEMSGQPDELRDYRKNLRCALGFYLREGGYALIGRATMLHF